MKTTQERAWVSEMPKLFTVPEAARKARVSVKVVRQAIYDQALNAAKVGLSWLIIEMDLDDWIQTLNKEPNVGDDSGDGNAPE